MANYIAIGDIHGMNGMLEKLLGCLPEAGTLVFLGDYIDRGPGSRKVIERLLELEQQRTCVFLRGNHEMLALDALKGDQQAELTWIFNGGAETITDYDEGIFSPEHHDFLKRTQLYHLTAETIFVHAGLEPGIPVELNEERTFCWMREPFLSSAYNWGRLVVHGHTPNQAHKTEIRPNRINIDTGAVYGGALTALLLPEREFIAVTGA